MTSGEKLKYYLEAMNNIFEKNSKKLHVVSVFEIAISEDEVNENQFFGDGYCLWEEIKDELRFINQKPPFKCSGCKKDVKKIYEPLNLCADCMTKSSLS